MSTITGPNSPTRTLHKRPAIPSDPVFRLSVEQYHAMINSGILTKDDSVELLEGWLIEKMSQNPPHSVAAELVAEKLRELHLDGFCIRSEKPITLSDSEPEPDVAVARGPTRNYIERHPSPNEVPLVIEVADASIDQDRGVKRRAYARAGVAVYWIVNLRQRQIEVYTSPSGAVPEPSYASRQDYPSGAEIPLVIDGKQVATLKVGDLLP